MRNISLLILVVSIFSCKNINTSIHSKNNGINVNSIDEDFFKMADSKYNTEDSFKTFPGERFRFYSENNKDLKIRINTTESKKVYFVFTNLSGSSSSRIKVKQMSGGSFVSSKDRMLLNPVSGSSENNYVAFNYKTEHSDKPIKTKENYIQKCGELQDQLILTDYFTSGDKITHYNVKLLYRSPEIDTAYGVRQLEVYFNIYPSSTKSRATYVKELKEYSKKFLMIGDHNDLFDYESSILGEDMSLMVRDLKIMNEKIIRIVFTDIDNDYPAAGYAKEQKITYGVFSPNLTMNVFKDETCYKDNIRTLLIDLPTLDNADKYPNLYSILVHEFQHLLSFGLRPSIAVQDHPISIPYWLNEGLSMAMTDIFTNIYSYKDTSEKLFSHFLERPSNQFRPWLDGDSYNVAFAFFAYILRNFGGADFIKAMELGAYKHRYLYFEGANFDETAFDIATKNLNINENFSTMMRKFGASVLVSDLQDNPTTIGFPHQTTTINGIKYTLNQLNFQELGKKYGTSLLFYSTAQLELGMPAYSNAYYDSGYKTIPGQDILFKISVPKNVYVTAVIRD